MPKKIAAQSLHRYPLSIIHYILLILNNILIYHKVRCANPYRVGCRRQIAEIQDGLVAVLRGGYLVGVDEGQHKNQCGKCQPMLNLGYFNQPSSSFSSKYGTFTLFANCKFRNFTSYSKAFSSFPISKYVTLIA